MPTPAEITPSRWFVERPHPEDRGKVQVSVFNTEAEAWKQAEEWQTRRVWLWPPVFDPLNEDDAKACDSACLHGTAERIREAIAKRDQAEAIVSAARAWKDARQALADILNEWRPVKSVEWRVDFERRRSAADRALADIEATLLAALETPGAGTGETR